MQILQSTDKVGPGFCPEIVRKAGLRRCRRPDKRDAGSSLKGGKIAATLVVFHLKLRLRRFRPKAAQIRRVLRRGCFIVLSGKGAHNASQRLLCANNRVDRNDFSDTGKIDTFGTLQLDEPLAVAAVNTC